MRSQRAVAWWRAATWTLLCLMSMGFVLSVITTGR
jgi:hypothetical protein